MLGHRATECAKDPNIRSTFDAEEELKRIEDIRQRKKQGSSSELSRTLACIFKSKLDEEDLELNYGSSPSVSFNSDEEAEGKPPLSTNFADIAELKEEIGRFESDRNLLQIAQFSSGEAEKGQQVLMNARALQSPKRSEGRKLTLKQRMQLNRE